MRKSKRDRDDHKRKPGKRSDRYALKLLIDQVAQKKTAPENFFDQGDDDDEAKKTVARLIDDAGFAAVDVGGLADASVMEAPRREGAVYGEEFTEQGAREFLDGRGR